MRQLRITACAKVNLSLEVLGKRPDGFHEVLTVMQSISLSDELVMEPAETLSLTCDLPGLDGDDNLVLRSARALSTVVGRPSGARIELHKGIPVASGLGGASADAAAVLLGLSRLWGLEMPAPRMSALAASLGSDVPFFLAGGTAMASGRGEIVQPLPARSAAWLVLLVPPHSLVAKTAELYRRLRPEHWSSGQRTTRLAELLARGDRLTDDLLGNSFEAVADQLFPALPACREAMRLAGAPSAHLSGAGPALFSLLDNETTAERIAALLARAGHHPLVAHTVTAEGGCLAERRWLGFCSPEA